MSLIVAVKCEDCGAKMGTMQVKAVSGGKVTKVKEFIQPRVVFYCVPCSKVNRS